MQASVAAHDPGNPIESAFATASHRSHQTVAAVSRETVLPLAFKLIHAAQADGRKRNGRERLAKIITAVHFAEDIEVHNDASQEIAGVHCLNYAGRVRERDRCNYCYRAARAPVGADCSVSANGAK